MEKERNLLNVAVSRARRALVVLGHPDITRDRVLTRLDLDSTGGTTTGCVSRCFRHPEDGYRPCPTNGRGA